MSGDLLAIQRGQPNPAVKETILGLGMRYRLLTQFTSFVAVEHKMVIEGGVPRKVAVPVEMSEGVSHEGVFGERGNGEMAQMQQAQSALSARMAPLALQAQRIAGGGQSGGREALRDSVKALKESPQALPSAEPARDRAADAADDGRKLKKDYSADTSKLAPELAQLVLRLNKDGKQATGKFAGLKITDGRVEIRVTLSVLSDEVAKKLTALGFKEKTRAAGANVIEGTIAVEKLEELSKLAEVRRVEPVK